MRSKDLAEAHWSYIEKLLLTHGEPIENVEKIGFHYMSSMIHGYGHGHEDAMKEVKYGEETKDMRI
jgi:hypothetical protein